MNLLLFLSLASCWGYPVFLPQDTDCVINLPPQKGYFSRAWDYVASWGSSLSAMGEAMDQAADYLVSWWSSQSRTHQVAWFAFGGVTTGVIYYGASYLLAFETIEDFFAFFGSEAAKKGIITTTGGVVITPTSRQVAASVLAGATSAVVSSISLPQQAPIPECDFVPPPRKFLQTGCAEQDCGIYRCRVFNDGARYNGRCIKQYSCARDGSVLYIDGQSRCRCPRICKAIDEKAGCTYLDPRTGMLKSCKKFPACDTDCDPVWCQDCVGSGDPRPNIKDIDSWVKQHNLQGWEWGRCPGVPR